MNRLHVRLMCTENMKQLACIVSRLSNGMDKIFKVKVILLWWMVKYHNDLKMHRSILGWCAHKYDTFAIYSFWAMTQIQFSRWRSKYLNISTVHSYCASWYLPRKVWSSFHQRFLNNHPNKLFMVKVIIQGQRSKGTNKWPNSAEVTSYNDVPRKYEAVGQPRI